MGGKPVARVGLLPHAVAVPLALAEAAVDVEGVREKKRRSLPSVLIVYLNLALWLFPDQGMGQCLRELAAGLPLLVRARPSGRRRLRPRSARRASGSGRG